MANIAKDLDIALRVAEEGAKVARKAKVKPTVKEAERIAFPGIYDDPRVVAEKAASRVAPESPAMKQLFGVTRDDLYEMSKGRKGNITGKLPGEAKNPKGSKAAEKVMTKKNEQRLLDALYEAEKYPELIQGMDPWYTMDPLYKQMVQLVGPEKAKEEYKKFNTLLGMASPGAEVTTEIPRGTAAYFLQKEGRFPDFEKYIAIPSDERSAVKDFPTDIINVPGHIYHTSAQSTPMSKYLKTGEMTMKTPKVPMYIEASGVPETGFQTDIPVGDAHWSRAVGLADTRTAKRFDASVSTPEMSMLAPWWREKVAGEAGLESVPAQARTWGLFSPQTGVTTPIGKPKLEMIADKIMETAIRLNISPEDARDLVLMGKTYAGKAGGGSIKALDKALKVGEKVAKETLKKAKDYKPTKGKISEVKDYIRDTKGEYGAQRVERAADLVPNLEKQYSVRALREAFDGDNAKSVMVMNPADYEKYARQLPEHYGKSISGIQFKEGKQVPITIPPEKSYYDILTGKDPLDRSDYTAKKMMLDEYLDYLGKTAREEGLLETPYLMLDESLNLPNYRIAGHEGRHRSRALAKLGDESTLIRLLPRGIREGLPRGSQEEYQQGLQKLLGPNPKVYPEHTMVDRKEPQGFYNSLQDKIQRPLIELPEFFAEGGSTKKPSFFPKDSKPHKQGFPIEYEEYYPRSTRPESELLEEFNKDELTARDYFKAVPTIAKTTGKMLKEQAKEELPTYLEPRAIPDIALNALATGVGSISDLAHLGTGVERPVLGSEQLMDLLSEYGITSGTKRPLAENLLAVASPKVLRTAEQGLNKLVPIAKRSFTPLTTTVEAVAPDLAKFRPRDFQEYVTNRLISNQYGGTPMNFMGDEITKKLPAQGVYFNEAGELETNPMMAIDIPNIKDVSKAKALRADIASAGKALNQESMAGIRFLPLATNKLEDATAILVKPKSGKISNEDVIKLGNEFGNSMVVSHNPRLGGVVLAPFDKPSGELQSAQSKIKDLFGSDMNIKAGHSDLQKDRFYMPKSDYQKEGARKVPKSTKAVREELKKAESLRYREPSFLSDTNPLSGGISD